MRACRHGRTGEHHFYQLGICGAAVLCVAATDNVDGAVCSEAHIKCNPGRPIAFITAATDITDVRVAGCGVRQIEKIIAATGCLYIHMNFIPDCPINIVQINFQKAAR